MFATVYQVTREGVFVYTHESPCATKKKFIHRKDIKDPWLQLIKGDKVEYQDGELKRGDFVNCFHCNKAVSYSEEHQEMKCICRDIKGKIWSEGVLVERKHKMYKTGLGIKLTIENPLGETIHPVFFENEALYDEFSNIPLGTLVRYKAIYRNTFLNIFTVWY